MRPLLIILLLWNLTCSAQFIYINQGYTNPELYNSDQEATDLVKDGDDFVLAQIGNGADVYTSSILRLSSSLDEFNIKPLYIPGGSALYRGRTLTRCSGNRYILNGDYGFDGDSYGFAYLVDSMFNVMDSVFLVRENPMESRRGLYKFQQTPNGRIFCLGGRETTLHSSFERPFVELSELFAADTNYRRINGFMMNTRVQNITDFVVTDDSLAFVCGAEISNGSYNANIYLLKCNLDGDSLGVKYFGGPCAELVPSLGKLNNGMLILAYPQCIQYYIDDSGNNGISPMYAEFAISLIDPISFNVLNTYTYQNFILEDFIKSPYVAKAIPTEDGGALILASVGYGTDIRARPMALKVDADMNMEWFEPYFAENGDPELTLFSNAVEWRDGYFAVGSMRNMTTNKVNTWLASIDKCGKMVDLGCYPQDTLSVNEAHAANLQAWPNPASDVLHLTTPQPVKELRLWDAAGRLVLRTSNTNEVSVAPLDNGVYLLDVTLQTGLHCGTRVMVAR